MIESRLDVWASIVFCSILADSLLAFSGKILFKTPAKNVEKIGSKSPALSLSSVPYINPKAKPVGRAISQAPLKHIKALALKVANLSKGEFLTSNLSDLSIYLMCLNLL